MEFVHSSDIDVAHYILSEKKEYVYYKDLILEIIEKQEKTVQSLAATISEIYTHINMDSRFHYAGTGMWGLTAWVPVETKRSAGRSSVAAKVNNENSNHKKKLESIQE